MYKNVLDLRLFNNFRYKIIYSLTFILKFITFSESMLQYQQFAQSDI